MRRRHHDDRRTDGSVTTGTGSPAGGRPCVGPTGTTLAPTTTVTEPVEP